LPCEHGDLAAMLTRLESRGVEYTVDEVEEPKRTQLFLRDPAGKAVDPTFVR
jgi:hypothetical protein